MYGPPLRSYGPPGSPPVPRSYTWGPDPLPRAGLFIIALILAYLLLPVIKLFLTLIILLIAAYIIYRLLLYLISFLYRPRGMKRRIL